MSRRADGEERENNETRQRNGRERERFRRVQGVELQAADPRSGPISLAVLSSVNPTMPPASCRGRAPAASATTHAYYTYQADVADWTDSAYGEFCEHGDDEPDFSQ